MAGTPEEDLLGWLEREEERLGFSTTEAGLADYEHARDLFYDELGYDITEEQFAGLKSAQTLRYEELPSIGIVEYGRFERPWGYQPFYRDVEGKFAAAEDIFNLLATIR